MIPGLPIETLLTVHVAISLIGIASGLVAMPALAAGRWLPTWQAVFLVTTALTSITGFLFPFGGVTPGIVFGVISLVALAIASLALPGRATRRIARVAYGVSATLALYLNLVVLVVQSFQKVSVLQPLAPTQSEPPFLAAQSVIFIAVLVIGWFSVKAPRGAPGLKSA